MRLESVLGRGFWRAFAAIIIAGAVIVLLAGAGFALAEHRAVSSYWEGVWWAISLATTAGFAGESPTTTSGYVLSAAIMLIGFWLLTLATAALASLFVREEEEPAQEAEIALEVEILTRLDELAARLERVEQSLTRRD